MSLCAWNSVSALKSFHLSSGFAAAASAAAATGHTSVKPLTALAEMSAAKSFLRPEYIGMFGLPEHTVGAASRPRAGMAGGPLDRRLGAAPRGDEGSAARRGRARGERVAQALGAGRRRGAERPAAPPRAGERGTERECTPHTMKAWRRGSR